jgi:hypothetical protein
MIPDRDYYADKDGKITDDMSKAARQIGVKGHVLDDKIARRYGILIDDLVPVNEPDAPRRMMGSIPARKTERNEASVKVAKVEEKQQAKKPQEPADADEAKKPAAKKETKKK